MRLNIGSKYTRSEFVILDQFGSLLLSLAVVEVSAINSVKTDAFQLSKIYISILRTTLENKKILGRIIYKYIISPLCNLFIFGIFRNIIAN
jgi:hypothetical protein